MILEDIASVVKDVVIPIQASLVGGEMQVDADGFEEYPWGWMFYLEAVDPVKCTNRSLADCKFLFLIERETGYWESGTPSPALITRFLQHSGREPSANDEDPIETAT